LVEERLIVVVVVEVGIGGGGGVMVVVDCVVVVVFGGSEEQPATMAVLASRATSVKVRKPGVIIIMAWLQLSQCGNESGRPAI
jgi:hypothetical protein